VLVEASVSRADERPLRVEASVFRMEPPDLPVEASAFRADEPALPVIHLRRTMDYVAVHVIGSDHSPATRPRMT
jgi:hypothetical protein